MYALKLLHYINISIAIAISTDLTTTSKGELEIINHDNKVISVHVVEGVTSHLIFK